MDGVTLTSDSYGGPRRTIAPYTLHALHCAHLPAPGPFPSPFVSLSLLPHVLPTDPQVTTKLLTVSMSFRFVVAFNVTFRVRVESRRSWFSSVWLISLNMTICPFFN